MVSISELLVIVEWDEIFTREFIDGQSHLSELGEFLLIYMRKYNYFTNARIAGITNLYLKGKKIQQRTSL